MTYRTPAITSYAFTKGHCASATDLIASAMTYCTPALTLCAPATRLCAVKNSAKICLICGDNHAPLQKDLGNPCF
ncbi:MAG: hypothetical protein IPM47_06115 [Sphingobacteriales bacterium]|nr:MAG: hypothetical protein IPM47_06115 [Sphingobacteriales bacterium]